MKAAIVLEAGKAPVYGDFKEPVPGQDEVRINVAAAALSNVVRSRASGTHYSSSGELPFVVGIDGVGRLDEGRRVYFVLPKPPLGSMSERTVVKSGQCIDLPDGLDDVTAAAIANPGMSAWAAMKERAKLAAGETVLVNGATGTAGRLAVQIAKYMGAKKVIATGRNIEVLKSLASLGADMAIPLVENGDAMEEAFQEQFAEGIDVVVDYLWGQSAERLIIAGAKAGREAVPIRFVQVGSAGARDITLPSAALRSSAIELMGSGIGSVPVERLLKSIDELMQATLPGGFKIATKAIPLSAVEQTWATAENMPRTVFKVA
ncbi:MAG TPA: zinc-binding alcohol dehydrogenase family protein [Candidatus Sulfotelmatobacter sp.]|jgi:NADPH:quinone reductase-like Zn-dependent oxidoreductase|nr:zinc-binding alcohol dehydrogenase family protein [Candidatus Sulfotelmatobacter sp.]